MLLKGYQIVRQISSTGALKNRVRYTFHAAFGKYLFATNTISSGVLMLIGDLLEQEFHHDFKDKESGRYDYGRLAKMFTVGLTMGPVHHYYYGFVNKLWPKKNFKDVITKVSADQFVMSPICIAQFFYTLAFLDKQSLKDANEEFKKKFIKVYTMDWCVWVPAQFINFYLIPFKYQVIYINLITTVYNVFLSYIKYDVNI